MTLYSALVGCRTCVCRAAAGAGAGAGAGGAFLLKGSADFPGSAGAEVLEEGHLEEPEPVVETLGEAGAGTACCRSEVADSPLFGQWPVSTVIVRLIFRCPDRLRVQPHRRLAGARAMGPAAGFLTLGTFDRL